jgi:hypothetical protein
MLSSCRWTRQGSPDPPQGMALVVDCRLPRWSVRRVPKEMG